MMSNLDNPELTKTQTWYTAELVLKINVEGDPRTVVHKNLMLIMANDPRDAYEKAEILGAEHQMLYANPEGKQVRIEFIGLRKLNLVYDRLEHGAELLYEEYVGLSDLEISAMIVPKHNLSVFTDVKALPGPDYSSAEILDKASKLIRRG